MTIVIALKDEKNKKIYLGADRQGTRDDMAEEFGCKLLKIEIPLSDGKIDEMYFAFSGSAFLHEYLLNVFQAPIFNVETNFVNYLYSSFFNELKNELLKNKLIKIDKEVLDSESGLIIVHGEDIYDVWYDLSIVKCPTEYTTHGSGYEIASAIIENNIHFHQGMDYKKIVGEALYTTGKLNIYCSEDYDILTIDY